ncbi:alpha/beta fold hydrolase [Vibrio ostreicida]|uniref:alpha/beta fold hydrolase n=1 Tax=Vibrio ostreicida TaxID=526588 RepID=UPI003B599271
MKKSALGRVVLTFLVGVWFHLVGATEPDDPTFFTKEGVAYTKKGNPYSQYRLIFIHGSPGNKEGFSRYMNDVWLLNNAELISLDRLGYGSSPRELEANLDAQAQSLEPLLSPSKVNILVGHSLGAPIALNFALMSPQSVQGMVLVAPAFSPKLEQPKWYNKLADTWLVGLFLSQDWHISNREMMSLSNELAKVSQKDWHRLDSMPVILIHGQSDTISDPQNSAFAMKKLSGFGKQHVQINNEGHFILWQNPSVIIDEIKRLIQSGNVNYPS